MLNKEKEVRKENNNSEDEVVGEEMGGQTEVETIETDNDSNNDNNNDSDSDDNNGNENKKSDHGDRAADEGLEEVDASKQLKSELEDFKGKYYYLAAELDNVRKRFLREKENLVKFSNERLLGDLLDVADNFDRTISMVKKTDDEKTKNIVVGIEMINNQFMGILNKYGLAPVKSVGEVFNPNFHEAVSERLEKNKKALEVVEEYQKGYLLNGRLIRPAKVVVSKQEEL